MRAKPDWNDEGNTPDDVILHLVRSAVGERYEVMNVVGKGGLAWVCGARDAVRDATVALKMLRPSLSETVSRTRMIREINLGRQIAHPNVIPVFDGDVASATPWMSMPLSTGGSLRRSMRESGGAALGATLMAIRSISSGLAAIHRHGFLHRDLSPENVLEAAGQYWICDLGAARELGKPGGEATEGLTPAGVGLGRLEYLAPELLAGAVPDVRADLYSWGVISYELLTGTLPIHSKDPQAWLRLKNSGVDTPIRQRRSSVPPSLESLIHRCLEPSPADRPASAERVWDSLNDIVSSGILDRRRDPAPETASRLFVRIRSLLW